MTQLDVPNISFTHYLDLLKRRTWHVIIVSVLGLVVGGVVAMLIPRYYVATTTIELNRPILDPNLGTPRDPFSQLINAAIVTVPSEVPKALRELKWLEAVAGTMEDQRAFETATQSRVMVHDRGPGNKDRRIAHLMISYRDLDGDRAAAMANELRKQWTKEWIDGLVLKAEAELIAFARVKQSKQVERLRAAREVQLYEEANGIDPQNWKDPRARGVISVLSNEIRMAQKDIAELKIDGSAATRKIASRRRTMDGTSPTLRTNVQDLMTDPGMRAAYLKLLLAIRYTSAFVKGVKPAHPGFDAAKLTLATKKAELAELEKIAGGEAADRPNPVYKSHEAAVAQLELDKGLLMERLADKRARLEKLQAESKLLPAIYFKYEGLLGRLKLFQKQEATHNLKLEEKRAMITRIRTERPYRILTVAHPPPTPTEPNPYMLAMMGCIVGLAVAIALVLLIDFLQMSFKSVADVESGLGLPVLGTMSYLETDAETVSIRNRRTRVTIFGVAFLVLVLTIVTLYYVMPTSLPAVVIDILEDVLGKRG